MPTRRIDYVNQPYAGKRHTPDTSRLGSIYARGGETLADIALQKGANTAKLFERLGSIFTGYQELERAKKDQQAALALRKQEKADERDFDAEQKKLDRDERAAERKAAEDARKADKADAKAIRATEREEDAVVDAVNRTRPGVVSPALYEQVKRLSPQLAERFTVLDGAPVLKEDATQARQREIDAANEAERKAAAGERTIDNARADKQLAATIAASTARQQPNQKFVIRNGQVVPILDGEAQPGDVPYSADAMQGMGGEASDVRSSRAAAALNSIDKLKTLAPKRSPGLPGMAEGAAASAAGMAGYNTGARQYNALLQPTAMQMAVAIQGASGLSNAEREAMAKMLGSISTMDYETQMALLENASQMIRGGADVALVTVKDPKTGQPMQQWTPKRSRMPGSVTVGQPPPASGAKILSIVPVPPKP